MLRCSRWGLVRLQTNKKGIDRKQIGGKLSVDLVIGRSWKEIIKRRPIIL